ncbi:MAG: Gfo/Idh/MocA family protein [Candidatus Thorarchaeota archaeon]
MPRFVHYYVMDRVRFGVIGCGNAASFHVLPFKRLEDSKVHYVAAYDVNEKAVLGFSKRHGLTPYTDFDEFLQSDIDAVLIAAPHNLHAQLTKAAAEAGKHVLCEKPMATTLEECDEMILAAKGAGVKLMVAENHRFLPAHQLIKDALDGGLIGDVFLGRAYEGAFCPHEQFLDLKSWHFTYEQGGGGVVADQGVHKFSTLNWMLGEIDSVQCWLGKALNSPPEKGEDNAIVLLRYKQGAMITVDLSSITVHPLTNRLELHGTQGTILEDHAWEHPVQIFSSHDGAQQKGAFYSPEVEHGPYPKYYLISARCEDTHFAECIVNNTNPEFTPAQSRDAVAITLLAYLSAKEARTATMEELEAVKRTEGTKSILKDLGKVTQQNYANLRWR